MSTYYAESNLESSMLLFNKRMMYSARLMNTSPNIINFNFGEKIFYGRVDRYFSPICTTRDALKPIKYYDGKLEMSAISFVADIFNEMARKFQIAAQSGQIRSDDPYLSNLVAHAAFKSPQKLYADYHKIYSETIAKKFVENNIEVLNFGHFISELMGVITPAMNKIPYTFTAFVKSRRCSIMSSGLAIEIADLDYANDEEKISQLISSPNWSFFVNACNRYGFMIDQNVPWRIVMDIAAPEVHEITNRYGAHTTDAILTMFFQPAGDYQQTRFVSDLFKLYNRVRKNTVTTHEYCNASGKMIQHVRYPVEYKSVQELRKSYNEKYWDNLYLHIRLLEERPDMSEYDREKLIREQIMVMDTAAINWHFERIINKMFDKAGSFSYYNSAIRARADKEFAEGSSEAYTVDLESSDGSIYMGD